MRLSVIGARCLVCKEWPIEHDVDLYTHIMYRLIHPDYTPVCPYERF